MHNDSWFNVVGMLQNLNRCQTNAKCVISANFSSVNLLQTLKRVNFKNKTRVVWKINIQEKSEH